MWGCDSLRLFLMPRWMDALTCVDVEMSLSGSNRLNILG